MNAWKVGYHCLLSSAHFLLNGSVRPVFAVWSASVGFSLYYSIQTTTTIPTQTALPLSCCLKHRYLIVRTLDEDVALARRSRVTSCVMYYAAVTE